MVEPGSPVVVCDLDGVVWLDGEALPGAAAGAERLRRSGVEVLFLTNNSSRRLAEFAEMLRRVGIDSDGTDVVSSATAAAHLLGPRPLRVHACAGPGVGEALERAGHDLAAGWPCDAVVVGWHRDFDFDRLERASTAVRRGARFVATNLDATYPTPGGLLPGGGAIVAAVATASGCRPEVAGKPERPTVELVRLRAGERTGWVVGDRPSTDGALAAALGWPFALVSSEVTRSEASADGTPVVASVTVADLDEAAAEIVQRQS